MFILSFVMFGECLVLYAHVNSDIKTIFHTGTRRSSQLHANLASFTGQHRIHTVNCVRVASRVGAKCEIVPKSQDGFVFVLTRDQNNRRIEIQIVGENKAHLLEQFLAYLRKF